MGYDDALTAFSEARSLLGRAEDAMQHAVQAEQQKNVDLRRELTEAREAQRKAVAELTAARDAQEKAEGRLEKLEEKNRDLKEEVEELEEKVQKKNADEKKKQRPDSPSSASGEDKLKKAQVSVKKKSASRSCSGSRANGVISPEREAPKSLGVLRKKVCELGPAWLFKLHNDATLQ
eukprot:g7569.t1